MKIKTKNKVMSVVLYVIMAFLSVIFLFPLFGMFSKSLMLSTEVYELPPKIWSADPQWGNYIKALAYSGSFNGVPYILVYLKNTLMIIALSAVGVILSSSMCAFGFSKISFPGRDKIFIGVLSTMMIPGVVTMIPLYILYAKVGWINHLYPLWAPLWFGGGGMTIFLVRQYMKTLPIGLTESAMIDGANYWQQYAKIIMPNCKPILTVLAIGAFLGPWNDLMNPLLYLNSKEKWTLALGITNLGMGQMGVTLVMAACAMMVIVPILIFLFGQKFFIDSVILTGMKG